MARYILKRVVSVITTLFILSIFVFSLSHIMVGDPAIAMLGSDATQQQVDQLRQEMGLNKPIITQYFLWIGGVLHGNLGTSYFRHESVMKSIGECIVPSLQLSFWAQLLATLIGIPGGILAAKRKGKTADFAISSGALIGLSMPSFLLGLLFILLFAVVLQILPVSGFVPISDGGLLQHLQYLVIPAVTLGLIQAALILRMTRSSFLETLNTDYIKTAKAKGLKQKMILYKHALRNAAPTIITVFGQSIGSLIAGAAVLETMFNIPGMGQLVVSSVLKRDYPVIQGVVLIVSIIYVVINLLVDLSYGIIDPRIRVTGKAN